MYIGKYVGREYTDRVHSVAYSPDGTKIISGSHDKSIRIWDAKTWTLENTLGRRMGWVISVAYSSDGTKIISGSHDKTIRIWDTHSGILGKK